jgi:hypothetical protein
MRTRQRVTIRGELAGLAFQLCSVVGLGLGLLYGLDASPAEPPRCKTEPCVADSFVAGLKPVLVPTGIGLAIGAGVGLVLALAIKKTDWSFRSHK